MRLRANRGYAVAGKTEHVIVSASAMRLNCSEQITDGRLRGNLTLMLAKILETLDLDEEHGEGRFLLSGLCQGRADGGGGVGPFHPAVRQRAGRRMPFATEANEESLLRLPDVGMFPVPVRIGRVRLRVDPLAKIRTHGVQATGNERRA
jgi:hypothetical protein